MYPTPKYVPGPSLYSLFFFLFSLLLLSLLFLFLFCFCFLRLSMVLTNSLFLFIFSDVNECQNNPCQNGGKCTNVNGGYSCSCVSGFEGKNCEKGIDKNYI